MRDVRSLRAWLFVGAALIVAGMLLHVLSGPPVDLLYLLCNTARAVGVVVAAVRYLRRPR